MRIIFFSSTPDSSAIILDALLRVPGFELVAVVTPPLRGRRSFRIRLKKRLKIIMLTLGGLLPEPIYQGLVAVRKNKWIRVERLARRSGAVVIRKRSNDPTLLPALLQLSPDLGLVAGLNDILPSGFIEQMPPLLNCHSSLLPARRGGNPRFWTLAEDDKRAGISIHHIDPGIDTGPVIVQQVFDIEPWCTGGELRIRFANLSSQMFCALLESMTGPPPAGYAQYAGGSYERLPHPASDYLLRFDESALHEFNRARAIAPENGLTLFAPANFLCSGQKTRAQAYPEARECCLKLELCEASYFPESYIGEPGAIQRTELGAIAVACNPGVLHFRKLICH